MILLRTILSWLFGVGVWTRNTLYSKGVLRVRSASVPVVSVGALEAGGSGKTPFTALLCGVAVELGFRPAVLIRGYRGGLERVGGEVAPGATFELVGDEALWLARSLSPIGVRVFAGRDRARLAGLAAARGADLLILDDGFQHRRLRRDLDIVLVDGDRDPTSLELLPRGPLREPASSLSRAQLLVVRGQGEAPSAWSRPFVRVSAEAVDVVDPALGSTHPLRFLVDREVTLLAGIARPERFRALVESHGARVVEARFFADHHVFSASDVAAPRAPLLTTEKDATRLPSGTSAWVLRHRLRLVEGESMLREALRVLRRRRNGPREG